jgi:hypothetical protein
MSDEKKETRGREQPRSATGEELVDVYLKRSVGRRDTGLFGPGPARIPRSLYESLQLSPDLNPVDGAGRPLPDSIGASVAGAGALLGDQRLDAHPTVKVDPETGDPVDDEDDDTVRANSPLAKMEREIRESAKNENRPGTQLAGESGSLDDLDQKRFPVPGQTEPTLAQTQQLEREERQRASKESGKGASGSTASAQSAQRGRVAGVEGDKPMTKSELKSMDQSVLEDLARKNNVRVPKKATKKILVDRLYDARVTLD